MVLIVLASLALSHAWFLDHIEGGKLIMANPAFGAGERHHDEYSGGGVSPPQTNLGIAG